MSDFSIPGVGSSKYGSDKVIEGLMRTERIPRDREQKNLDAYQQKKTLWQDTSRRLATLRDDARNLYSFKNPFNSRLTTSSDEAVATATATREALDSSNSVLVKAVATADRLMSDQIAANYTVAAGTYTFSVGDKNVELAYQGGSIGDFTAALNRKGGDLLKASTISAQDGKLSFIIESKKIGEKNKLVFGGAASQFALDVGLLTNGTALNKNLDLRTVTDWDKPVDPRLVAVSPNQSLLVNSGGRAQLKLDPVLASGNLAVEIQYRLRDNPPPPAPKKIQYPPGPAAQLDALSIEGAAPDPGFSEDAPVTPPSPNTGMLFALDDKGRAVALPALVLPKPVATDPSATKNSATAAPATSAPDTSANKNAASLPEIQTLKLNLSELSPIVLAQGDGKTSDTTGATSATASDKSNPNSFTLSTLAGLGIDNQDTQHSLEIVSVRVYDTKEPEALRPKHAISRAADAVVSVDGIEVKRDNNDIADLIPGVTITVKEPSEKPITIKVSPDAKSAKDAIINFVGDYNRLMGQLNIITRTDPQIIEEISYLTDDEKKKAKDNLGQLAGDTTMNSLRLNLLSIMVASYGDTDAQIKLLSQLGISTDSRRSGLASYDSTKLRGYLEIDEDALDKALATHIPDIQKLFGQDTNGDLIVDSGLAYKIDSTIKPYTETAGIIALKTSQLDNQITNSKRTLARLDEQLKDKESQLKDDYGRMEANVRQMESTSSSIDNFSKQNQN